MSVTVLYNMCSERKFWTTARHYH